MERTAKMKITKESISDIENLELRSFVEEWFSDSPTVSLHTSGSTGKPKLIVAEKSRMVASAQMTIDYLGLKPNDTALLCMSTSYIAGKMMVVRAIVGDLDLLVGDVSSDPLANETRHIDFAAMVPMQVFNSVANHRDRFENIGKVIIGGGAIDVRLEQTLASFNNEIFATYGMTETLSHVAMRRVNGVGMSDCFSPMDGVTLSSDTDGCLRIEAPHLCAETLQTNDIVDFKDDGAFRIIGRKDNVVCSGGIKIQVEEVEKKIAGLVECMFAVGSVADEKLGRRLVMVSETDVDPDTRVAIEKSLPKYWKPKSYIVMPVPMTSSSKIARKQLDAAIADYFKQI